MPEIKNHVAFGRLLSRALADSGLTREDLIKEVATHYGSMVRITDSDLRRYLNGYSLPKLNKLAALVDVLAMTNTEIVRLVRDAQPRLPKKRRQ